MPLTQQEEQKLQQLVTYYCNPTKLNATIMAMKGDEEYLFLSDHLPRSFQVTQVNPVTKEVSLTLNVITFNMMNKCHNTAECKVIPPYSNNPWNISETFNAFNSRRALQYKFLIEQLSKQQLSVAFLQEINEIAFCAFKFNKEKGNFESEIKSLLKKPPKELHYREVEQLLAFDFLRKLDQLKFKAFATNKSMNCKPMVTIVNHDMLKVDPTLMESILPIENNPLNKRAGFVLHANLRGSSQQILLINIHLDYSTNYSLPILQLQMEMLQNQILGIMAGDTNHPINGDIIGAINNWNFPSNLDLQESSSSSSSNHELTTQDSRFVTGKSYDNLFVNPSTNDLVIEIQELPGYFFKIINNKITIEKIPADALKPHNSMPGAPWIRRITLVGLTTHDIVEHIPSVIFDFTERFKKLSPKDKENELLRATLSSAPLRK